MLFKFNRVKHVLRDYHLARKLKKSCFDMQNIKNSFFNLAITTLVLLQCFKQINHPLSKKLNIFKQAVLRDLLSNQNMVGAMVEVKNMDAPKQLEGFWIAEVSFALKVMLLG